MKSSRIPVLLLMFGLFAAPAVTPAQSRASVGSKVLRKAGRVLFRVVPETSKNKRKMGAALLGVDNQSGGAAVALVHATSFSYYKMPAAGLVIGGLFGSGRDAIALMGAEGSRFAGSLFRASSPKGFAFAGVSSSGRRAASVLMADGKEFALGLLSWTDAKGLSVGALALSSETNFSTQAPISTRRYNAVGLIALAEGRAAGALYGYGYLNGHTGLLGAPVEQVLRWQKGRKDNSGQRSK